MPLPLSTPTKQPGNNAVNLRDKTPTPGAASGPAATKVPPTTNPADISSPHELTAFVETLLEQLDSKFDDMSSQILDRMGQMSSRVDAIEASIQDIINGDMSTGTPSVPQSPMVTGTPGSFRR